MIKYKPVKKIIEEIADVICNICGNTCLDRHGLNFEQATLKAYWGYATQMDLETHEAHICESCYSSKIRPLFSIDPHVKDYDLQ